MDAEITPDEVEALLESDDRPRVIDIRSPGAFGRGHIPGSENVPFGDLPDRIDEFADADRIVTVCPHGKASVQAARLISSYEGTGEARVESMAGGLDAWEGPLETDGAAVDGETPDSPF
ncbi:rhodanese-like domain-containing protein [Haloplanus litoreus]|uniref:Rhodanese-like domain-containing protein n=1 Tax=Haloplanus litoreus TaxID=767515 RepID=A0ABD5ZTZ2_9EURY